VAKIIEGIPIESNETSIDNDQSGGKIDQKESSKGSTKSGKKIDKISNNIFNKNVK